LEHQGLTLEERVKILQQILMATGILGEEWKHRMVAKQLRVATLTTNFAGLFFDYYIFTSKSLISMWLKNALFFFRILKKPICFTSTLKFKILKWYLNLVLSLILHVICNIFPFTDARFIISQHIGINFSAILKSYEGSVAQALNEAASWKISGEEEGDVVKIKFGKIYTAMVKQYSKNGECVQNAEKGSAKRENTVLYFYKIIDKFFKFKKFLTKL
jgi:hypothetical protein